jgi:hypothetical protein
MLRASLCLSIVAAVAASLPQTPPERIFGSWFFMSAGVKVQPVPASAPIPHWLPSSVTVASFAFISPEELDTMGDHALPQAFRTRVAEFLSAGVRVSFSIGGESFANDWTFLASESRSRAAGAVAGHWAAKYSVGIEVDYEGPAATGGSWGINSAGVAQVDSTLLNLGVFIEAIKTAFKESNDANNRKLDQPSLSESRPPLTQRQLAHAGWVSLDVFASQGGGPGLTYLMNRYVKGMPDTEPSWWRSGPSTCYSGTPGLDAVNIMVAGGDGFSQIKTYIDGYVGDGADVATQWNSERIYSALPSRSATVGMIADHICGTEKGELPENLKQVIEYAKSEAVDLGGLMFWAVAPYGCAYNDPLKIGDWDCRYNASCPGMLAGRHAFLGSNGSGSSLLWN